MGMGKISGMPGGVLGGMGGGRGSNAYQPFGMKENYVREGNESVASDRSGSLGLGLSEKEIDERVCVLLGISSSSLRWWCWHGQCCFVSPVVTKRACLLVTDHSFHR